MNAIAAKTDKSFSGAVKAQEIKQIKGFLQDCQIIDLSTSIKEKAIELRRTYGLKLPDAIIAATAIEMNLPLMSGDGIFNRVAELSFAHYTL